LEVSVSRKVKAPHSLPYLILKTVGAFVALKDQYWVAYHVTILFAALLLVECLFLKETLYPRALVLTGGDGLGSPTNEKSGTTNAPANVKRTSELGYLVRLYAFFSFDKAIGFREGISELQFSTPFKYVRCIIFQILES
jgi:hypothetical protein